MDCPLLVAGAAMTTCDPHRFSLQHN